MEEKEEKVYTPKDLVSFGLYLLSNERRKMFITHPEFTTDTLQERLSRVYDADIENWKETVKEI
jgi:hypothetical protein